MASSPVASIMAGWYSGQEMSPNCHPNKIMFDTPANLSDS